MELDTPSAVPTWAVIIKNCAHAYEASDSLHHSSCAFAATAPSSWPETARSRSAKALSSTPPRRSAASIRTRSWPDLPAPPPTPSPCSAALKSKLEQYHGNLGRARRRTGQRLAHRQVSAPSGSPAAGRRQRADLPAQRTGRRHRARRRHCRHRQRRPLRPGRRPGPGRAHPALRPPDRRRSNEDCRQDLHLYQ